MGRPVCSCSVRLATEKELRTGECAACYAKPKKIHSVAFRPVHLLPKPVQEKLKERGITNGFVEIRVETTYEQCCECNGKLLTEYEEKTKTCSSCLTKKRGCTDNTCYCGSCPGLKREVKVNK